MSVNTSDSRSVIRERLIDILSKGLKDRYYNNPTFDKVLKDAVEKLRKDKDITDNEINELVENVLKSIRI